MGDTAYIDPDELLTYKCVEKVLKVQEPYKKANRLFHPADTIVDVNGSKVGGKYLFRVQALDEYLKNMELQSMN